MASLTGCITPTSFASTHQHKSVTYALQLAELLIGRTAAAGELAPSRWSADEVAAMLAVAGMAASMAAARPVKAPVATQRRMDPSILMLLSLEPVDADAAPAPIWSV
jgi:hypothetical protein